MVMNNGGLWSSMVGNKLRYYYGLDCNHLEQSGSTLYFVCTQLICLLFGFFSEEGDASRGLLGLRLGGSDNDQGTSYPFIQSRCRPPLVGTFLLFWVYQQGTAVELAVGLNNANSPLQLLKFLLDKMESEVE